MKSINSVVLEKRRNAIKLSKKISHNKNICKIPLEVKLKRSKLGGICGAIFILISGLVYIIDSSNLASGIFVTGVLTLGVNLVILKTLTMKKYNYSQ